MYIRLSKFVYDDSYHYYVDRLKIKHGLIAKC